MTGRSGNTGLSLEIRRVFQASREKVFAAWTKKGKLEQWMCRDVPTHVAEYLELDVRPGGKFAIEIKLPDGASYIGKGIFREVIPPEKLVFTWSWWHVRKQEEEPLQSHESLVTIKLVEKGTATEMLFLHELIESTELRENHRKGWEGCFNLLSRVLEHEHQGR